MSARRHWLIAALLLAAAALPQPAFAGAGEGVGYRLTGEPDSTLTGGFIRLSGSPGGVASAHFIASNTTQGTVNVAFFGADGDTTRATGAVFGTSSPTGMGGWITPSRRSASLPPGSELPIDVTVRIPPSAGIGDHVGAVIMEQQENASTATVKQVVRYAVPLLVDISGGGGPQIELGTARMGRISGTDIVTVQLPMRNAGTRICRPLVSANVGRDGAAPITVQRQLDEILPGDRILYPLRLGEAMALGTYLVRADVTGCGNAVSTSASTKLEAKDTEAGTAPTTPATGGTGGDGDQTVTPVPLKRKSKGSGGGSDGGGASNRRSIDSSPAPVTTETDDDEAAAPVVPAKPDKPGWLRRAADSVVANVPEVLERASVPLGASALVGLLLLFQNALDRRDPKLAGAPRDRDDALRFDPNPLQT